MDIERFQPKYVRRNHHLSKMTFNVAKVFDLGGTKLNLQIQKEAKIAAVVTRVKHPASMARKLGRKTSVIETTAAGRRMALLVRQLMVI